MDKRAELIEAMARALYGCDQAGLAEAKSIGMKLVSGAITPWENLHQENREGYLRRARPALDIALKAAAGIAGGWKSSLRPGSQDRLSGHLEARRDIADAILALTSEGMKG